MELLAGILAFLQVAEIAVKIKNEWMNESTEVKKNLAELYNQIGDLMSEVTDDLQSNIYPHDKCARMAGLLHGFRTALTGKTDEATILRLENILDTASRVEQLLGQLNSCTIENKYQQILALRQAAGTFKAEAMLLVV